MFRPWLELQELPGSLVIDSEGYVFGKVLRYRTEDEDVVLTVVTEDEEEIKGTVRLSEVVSAGLTELGTEDGEVLVWKILILREPREVQVRGEVRRPDLTELRGRLVVTLEGRVLGYVQDLCVTRGGVALKVVAPEVHYVLHLRHLTKLRGELQHLPLLYTRVRGQVLYLDDLLSEGLEHYLQVLRKHVRRVVVKRILTLPLTRIHRVGDVVLAHPGTEGSQ